jgi:hypothetical protein
LGTVPTSARRWTRSPGGAGVRTARSGGAPRRPPRTPSTASATCTAAATVQESLWKRSSPPRRTPSSSPRRPQPASRTNRCIRRASPETAAVEAAEVASRLARSAWGLPLSCTWTVPQLTRPLLVEGAKISGAFLQPLSHAQNCLVFGSPIGVRQITAALDDECHVC